MSTAAFTTPSPRFHGGLTSPKKLLSSNMAHESLMDRRMSSANEGMFLPTALLLRKLPRGTTSDLVKTLLLFAKDLQDFELIPNEYAEDAGYATAVARFSNVTSASEVQTLLNGKPNPAGQANMIVEMVSNSSLSNAARRNTMDPSTTRGVAQSLSPPPPQPPKSSRFNGTFQSIEKLSPPTAGSQPVAGNSDSSTHLQSIFSPQSPVGNNVKDRARVSGKSVIDEETGDDETGELLKDPLAYMKSGSPALHAGSRQSNNQRLPMAAFNSLSLNTNMNGPSSSSYASPRSAMHMHTPNSAFSPGGHPYPMGGQHYLRHNYPPVNPADQNPPCNTLYVGNLPMDTSEDELKAMFSKQRGYKRLCFRTKQNGPMCFVEFEDVSFATKALNELYGVQLHNSVKGGIRLSFSKNPLGVRSGQPGSANPATPLSTAAPGINGFSPMSPGGFSTANGPPPGLAAPPGLNMSSSISPPLPNGQFNNQNFSVGSPPSHGGRVVPMGNGMNQNHGGGYPDYMMGR